MTKTSQNENGRELQENILKAAREYVDKTGNSAYIPVENLEETLDITQPPTKDIVQTALAELEIDHKIEIVAKGEDGLARAIKLAHWTIRNHNE